MLFNEMSTFFLNYRIFLLDYKLNNTRIYGINAICFALTFFIFRICLNFFLCFYIMKIILKAKVLDLSSAALICGIILVVMFASLLVLNLIWFKGIIAHARRNMNHHEGTEEEKAKLAANDESTVTINSRENYNSFS